MTSCPRCGSPAEFLTPDHLDRCGEAADGYSRSRFTARDYVGVPEAMQAEMRGREVEDELARQVFPTRAADRRPPQKGPSDDMPTIADIAARRR